MTVTAMTRSSTMDWVRFYIGLGWFIFPVFSVSSDGLHCSCGRLDCKHPGKHPQMTYGSLEASNDLATAVEWFTKEPNANIGVNTLKSGIVPVDIDPAHGGWNSWAILRQELGLTDEQVDTVTALTGGGGEHFLFKAPSTPVKNSAGKLGDGIDIRGEGGYIVICPSNHLSGNFYKWEIDHAPDEITMLPLPPALIQRLAEVTTKHAGQAYDNADESVIYGLHERHDPLMAKIGSLCANRNMTRDDVHAAAEAWNQKHCKPPCDDVRKEVEWTYTAEMAKRATTGTNGTGFGVPPFSEWSPIRALAEIENPMDFDLAIIPEAFRGYIADVAERMCVPVGFIAIPLLVTLGSVVGRQLGICPKEWDTEWLVVPNIFGMVISPPGTLKTPAQNAGTVGVNVLNRMAKVSYDAAELAGRDELDNAEREAKRLDRLLQQPKLSTLDKELLRGELREVRRVQSYAPKRRIFAVQDVTHEALAEVLLDNQNGVLLVRDELSGFLAGLETSGREAARPFYLECWNGTNPYFVKRKSDHKTVHRDGIDLPAVCASILGTIQPGPIRRLAGQASQEKGADGFIQRFQLLFVQMAPIAWVNVDRNADMEAHNRMLHIFEQTANLNVVALGARQGKIPYLCFSAEAQPMFNTWRDELENRVRFSSEPSAMIDFVAKMKKTVPTLALLFHLTTVLETGERGGISAEALGQACAWGHVLEQHARWLYSPAPLAPAQTLAKWIKRGDVFSGMTVRELRRKHWSGLLTEADVYAALETLDDLGWLRIDTKVAAGIRGGKPSEIISLHPDLERPQA